MKALKGTARLFRLTLRLDRVRLPLWIAANVGLVAVTLPQLTAIYNTEPERVIYTTTSASSAITRLLNGAISGPSIGNIAVVETFLLAALLFALMNIFLITRHTRQEEETNRSEVIGSTLVGRQAGLTAALILAVLANLVTAGLIFMVFRLNDFPMAGSLAYSLALGGLGMAFAGVAAVTAQLFENSRTANSLAGLVFGVAFMIRGLGDVLGSLNPGGLGVTPNFVSWLSPVGWVLNINAFTAERWWVLGLFAAVTVATVTAAYLLLSVRDVGAALFAPRPGRAHASPMLLKRFGLIWRLNRTSTIAWAAAIVTSGATVGAVAQEFSQLIAENDEMKKILEALGQGTEVTDVLFGFMFMIIAIATAAYGLQVLARMRTEESSGRLELVLSTPRSRHQWLIIYTVYAVITSGVILFLTGFTTGLVFGIIAGDIIPNIRSLSSSVMVHLPAVSVMLGLSLLLFGALPRVFVAITWTLLGASLMVFQLGTLLELPQLLIDLSPFTHTPPAPISDVRFQPLFILSTVALGLAISGFILFRRRDILTS